MNISKRTMEMLSRAHMYAVSFNLNFVGTEHILLALTDPHLSPVDEVLNNYGVTQSDVMDEIIKLSGREPGAFVEREGDANEIFARCTNRSKKILFLADYDARKTKLDVVEPEHVLLAILREGQCTAFRILEYHDFDTGAAAADLVKILRERAMETNRLEDSDDEEEDEENGGASEEDDMIARFFGKEKSARNAAQHKSASGKDSNSKTKVLDKFCKDLTAEAKEGRIDPVIGREEEISRVMQILVRRTKNNPCLIGEPGVGKTAIAEGLAQRS